MKNLYRILFLSAALVGCSFNAYSQNTSPIPIVDPSTIKHEVRDMEEQAEGDHSTPVSERNEIYVAVDKNAEFPGGQQGLMTWLTKNIIYPEEAYKNNVQGRVVVKFVVEKDGSIGETKVVRSVSPDLDAEALRVIKLMPNWTPAQFEGKIVRSYFNLPVTFRIPAPVPPAP